MSAIWTKEEEDCLRSLLSRDASISEIAGHLSNLYCDRTPCAVKTRIKRMSVPRQPKATHVTESSPPRDTWGRSELAAMNDAFCAAMEAALGQVKRDPVPPEDNAPVPMRASPAIHSLGSGWQI